MISFIIGGSGSGKSAYAEKLIMETDSMRPRYYLATMQIYDDEGRKKVERHCKMRAAKGFQTIECPYDVASAAEQIETGAVVLLECMSNLVANEMFSEFQRLLSEEIVQRVFHGILEIGKKAADFVIVSNNVFEDGIVYDESTLEYMHVLGRVNAQIAQMADYVIEVLAGIPQLYEKEVQLAAEKGHGMEFYFGGMAQGKLYYVQKIHGERSVVLEAANLATEENALEKQINDICRDKEKTIILNHFHRWVRRCMKNPEQQKPEYLTKQLIANVPKLVIICDEAGNGIVPMDASERDYRERLGRIQCEIAAKSERVERILCGMGQILK